MSRAVLLCAAKLGEETRALQVRAKDLGILLLDGGVIERGELAQALMHAGSKTLYAPAPPLSIDPPEIDWMKKLAMQERDFAEKESPYEQVLQS